MNFFKKKNNQVNPYVEVNTTAKGEFFFRLKRKFKQFADEHLAMSYTVMLVPHANRKPINLKLPAGLIAAGIITVFILLCCATYFAWQSFHLHQVAVENSGLKKISSSQAAQLENLTEMTDDMMNQLADLYESDLEFRKALDMEVSSGGKGGVTAEYLEEQINKNLKSTEKVVAGDLNLQSDLTLLYQRLLAMEEYLEDEKSSYKQIEKAVDAELDKQECLPTRWPIYGGTISSYFGSRSNPFGGYGHEDHGAIDISCSYGTPIYASGKGRVIQTGYDGGYGLTIVVDHGYGYQTRYSHCSRILVETGDTVKGGDMIGRVGSTGRSTGPHLDFVVTYNGTAMDPLDILS